MANKYSKSRKCILIKGVTLNLYKELILRTIYFNEQSYVLHNYPATLEISEEDFYKLENKDITMEEIIDKYSNINYEGYSKPIYEDTYVEGYEYLGEDV